MDMPGNKCEILSMCSVAEEWEISHRMRPWPRSYRTYTHDLWNTIWQYSFSPPLDAAHESTKLLNNFSTFRIPQWKNEHTLRTYLWGRGLKAVTPHLKIVFNKHCVLCVVMSWLEFQRQSLERKMCLESLLVFIFLDQPLKSTFYNLLDYVIC